MNIPLFYKSKPIFGFDIGHSSVKVTQLVAGKKGKPLVVGYGVGTFDPSKVKDGVLIDPEVVAKCAHTLITEDMVGSITTNRVVSSVPIAHTFSKILELPKLEGDDLDSAVKLETEQYVPVRLEDLYVDYEVINTIKNGKDEKLEVLMVAAKRALVDSYMQLFDMLGLEVELIEPTTSSILRAIKQSLPTTKPILIIDFGSESSDLTVYEKSVRVTQTVDVGGDHITNALMKSLKLTERQAYMLKRRYGLAKSRQQAEVKEAVEPILDKLVKQVAKVIKYHQDRNDKSSHISEVLMVGGGSNLPGLEDYLSQATKLKIVPFNPWEGIDFGSLQRPHPLEATVYATVTGSALYRLGGKGD